MKYEVGRNVRCNEMWNGMKCEMELAVNFKKKKKQQHADPGVVDRTLLEKCGKLWRARVYLRTLNIFI